jgi:hypothetical protein
MLTPHLICLTANALFQYLFAVWIYHQRVKVRSFYWVRRRNKCGNQKLFLAAQVLSPALCAGESRGEGLLLNQFPINAMGF